MDAPVLHREEPAGPPLAPDPAEVELRELYPHRAGIVRLGLIRSRDHRAAGDDETSRSLNGPEDLRILRTLRSVADVVVVGAQTIRAEHYGDLTLPAPLASTRDGLRTALPPLAIVTRSGDIPDHLSPTTTWIVTTTGASTRVGKRIGAAWADRVLTCGDDALNPDLMIDELAARGLTRVLCEGGPSLARRLLDRSVVDEYCLTTSESPGGADAPFVPPVPPSMRLAHRLSGGGFTIERWARP